MKNSNPFQIWLAAYDKEESSLSLGDFDVRHYDVVEEMGQPFRVTLRVASFVHDLDLEEVVGSRAAFSCERRMRATTPYRSWSGIVTSMAHLSAHEEGESYYELVIEPECAILAYSIDSRVYQHLSELEVICAVLESAGFSAGEGGDDDEEGGAAGAEGEGDEEEEQGTYEIRNCDPSDTKLFPKKESITQFEESDLAFISRLAERIGVSIYFEHANQPETKGRTHTRIILDYNPTKNEVRGGKPMTYLGQGKDEYLGSETDYVVAATVRRSLRNGKLSLRDYDFRQPAHSAVLHSMAIKSGVKLEESLERFDYVPGAFLVEDTPTKEAKTADKFGKVGEPKSGTEKYRAVVTARRMEAEHARSHDISFKSNALDLAPGTVCQFGGPEFQHPNPKASHQTKFLVVRSHFRGENHKGNHHQVCTAVPIEEGVSYRPPRRTPRPRINGVQTAVVIGAPGQEVNCDEWGRIRVQFHWDRKGKFGAPVDDDDLSESNRSAWVRVSQLWAGTKTGFVMVPRVGAEVVIQFIDGDPDRPVVMGSLANASTPPPFDLPQNALRHVWRSHCADNGYNEIFFDDPAGLVSMQAHTTFARKVGATETVDIGQQRVTKIGSAEVIDIGKAYALEVGEQNGISISGDAKKLQLQVGGNLATITLKEDHISICAQGTLHLHGDQGVEISSNKGTVSIVGGPNVTINTDPKCPAERASTLATAQPPHGPAQTAAPYKPAGQFFKPTDATLPSDDVSIDPPPPGMGGDDDDLGEVEGLDDDVGDFQEAMSTPRGVGDLGKVGDVAGQVSGIANAPGAGGLPGAPSGLSDKLGAMGQGALNNLTNAAPLAAASAARAAISGQNPVDALKGAVIQQGLTGAIGAAGLTGASAAAAGVAAQVAATKVTGGSAETALKTAVAGTLAAQATTAIAGAIKPSAAPPAAPAAAPAAPPAPPKPPTGGNGGEPTG